MIILGKYSEMRNRNENSLLKTVVLESLCKKRAPLVPVCASVDFYQKKKCTHHVKFHIELIAKQALHHLKVCSSERSFCSVVDRSVFWRRSGVLGSCFSQTYKGHLNTTGHFMFVQGRSPILKPPVDSYMLLQFVSDSENCLVRKPQPSSNRATS